MRKFIQILLTFMAVVCFGYVTINGGTSTAQTKVNTTTSYLTQGGNQSVVANTPTGNEVKMMRQSWTNEIGAVNFNTTVNANTNNQAVKNKVIQWRNSFNNSNFAANTEAVSTGFPTQVNGIGADELNQWRTRNFSSFSSSYFGSMMTLTNGTAQSFGMRPAQCASSHPLLLLNSAEMNNTKAQLPGDQEKRRPFAIKTTAVAQNVNNASKIAVKNIKDRTFNTNTNTAVTATMMAIKNITSQSAVARAGCTSVASSVNTNTCKIFSDATTCLNSCQFNNGLSGFQVLLC